jgi:hypothetical protein
MRDDLNLSRRELLGAAARWSVPTVVTLTLGSKVLQAQASCPPCQRKTGNTCRACQLNQMMNCNCEPCLGPPYCAGSSSLVAPSSPSTSVRAPGSQPLSQQGTTDAQRQQLYLEIQRQRARQQTDPVSQNPFGQRQQSPGLYDRLRPDTASGRRP